MIRCDWLPQNYHLIVSDHEIFVWHMVSSRHSYQSGLFHERHRNRKCLIKPSNSKEMMQIPTGVTGIELLNSGTHRPSSLLTSIEVKMEK